MELERKYYPPTRELGYYMQRAKARPPTGGFATRRTYVVPTSLRGSVMAKSLSPQLPQCHAWMLDDVEQSPPSGPGHGSTPGRSRSRSRSGEKGGLAHGHHGRQERPPISAKKARALATLRRNKMEVNNITR